MEIYSLQIQLIGSVYGLAAPPVISLETITPELALQLAKTSIPLLMIRALTESVFLAARQLHYFTTLTTKQRGV